MKNKIFLTSVFALAFACPAFAVDGNATIENGDTCNVDNLGTSTNNDTANLEAIWNPTQYQCPQGQYLFVGTEDNVYKVECRTCLPGSYCGGGTYTVESHANDILACSTVGDGSYTLSAGGSDANTDCYKTYSASCTQPSAPAHSTNVVYGTETASGTHNYGSTCTAVAPTCSMTFDCVNGYHKKTSTGTLQPFTEQYLGYPLVMVIRNVQQGHNPNWDYNDSMFNMNWMDLEVNSTAGDAGTWLLLSKNLNQPPLIGVSGQAVCNNISGNIKSYDEMYIDDDVYNDNSYIGSEGRDGPNCWCQIGGFLSSAQLNNNMILTSSLTSIIGTEGYYMPYLSNWVKMPSNFEDAEDCATSCPAYCARGVAQVIETKNMEYFTEAYTPLGATTSCEANSINLNWYNDNTKITPTNDGANQCTYDQSIVLPETDPQKTGYTFRGWRFRSSTPANNN